MTKVISLIVLLLILSSCSTDQPINNSISKVFQFNPKLKFTIKGYEENKEEIIHYSFADFCIDSENNFYILDKNTSEVLVYNSKGDFISKFGNKGYGPGEFGYGTEVFCLNDTIYIQDFQSRQILRFYKNKYLSSSAIESSFPYSNIKVVNNNRIVTISQASVLIKNKYYGDFFLKILDRNFNVISKTRLRRIKEDTDLDLDPLKFKTPYTFNDSLIYIPKISFDKYEIDIYGLDGNFKRTIKKKYHKINLNDSEKERLNEVLANVKKMGGGGMDNSKYKNAVNAIFIDKDNNLRSFNSVFRTDKNKDHLFVDRFNNDSLMQNIEVENFIKGEDLMYFNYKIKFKDEQIYVLDKENSELKIYEY